MPTVAAFLLIGLFVVAACEATRAQFLRLLADPAPRPVPPRIDPLR